MIPARISGCTRVLGAPAGWTPETSGPCCGLPIRDEINSDQNVMISAWEPTPSEIAALVAGAKVMLRVAGTGHPPVMLWTGEPPATNTTDREGEA